MLPSEALVLSNIGRGKHGPHRGPTTTDGPPPAPKPMPLRFGNKGFGGGGSGESTEEEEAVAAAATVVTTPRGGGGKNVVIGG